MNLNIVSKSIMLTFNDIQESQLVNWVNNRYYLQAQGLEEAYDKDDVVDQAMFSGVMDTLEEILNLLGERLDYDK